MNLRLHYNTVKSSIDKSIKKKFPTFNQYYAMLMKLCLHPKLWKKNLKKLDEIVKARMVILFKEYEDEFKQEEIDSDSDEDDIDWWNFEILGVKRKRDKDGKKVELTIGEKRKLLQLLQTKN